MRHQPKIQLFRFNPTYSDLSHHLTTQWPATVEAAPFSRTVPSENETVTTMLSKVSRVRNLNQTFCMQIMLTSKHVHRQSLSFPCCPPKQKPQHCAQLLATPLQSPFTPCNTNKVSPMDIVNAIITLTSTKATELHTFLARVLSIIHPQPMSNWVPLYCE